MSTLTTAFHWTSEKAAAKPSLLKGLLAALKREIRLRRAMRQIATLDDAALCDIGVSRGGIEDAVRHGRM